MPVVDRARTSVCGRAAVVRRQPAASPTTRSRPTASGRCSAPAATSSRSRPSTAPTRNLTQTPGVHERDSKWSPDGRWIAYVSDATRRGRDLDRAPGRHGRAARSSRPAATPTSIDPSGRPTARSSLWADKQAAAARSSTSTPKAVTLVATAAGRRDHRLSPGRPDSQLDRLRQARGPRARSRIYLYSLDVEADHPGDRRLVQLGEPGVQRATASTCSSSPTATSTRSTARPSSNHVYRDMSPDLLRDAGQGHEVAVRAQERRGRRSSPKPATGRREAGRSGRRQARDAKNEPRPPAPVKVDPDGLIDRIVAAARRRRPTTARSRRSATAVYYGRASTRDDGGRSTLYDLDEAEGDASSAPVGGYEISADGKKMLVGKAGDATRIIDLPDGQDRASKDTLDLAGHEGARSTAAPSGTRSTTSAGGRCATSSTRRTCTASTGPPCAARYEPLVAARQPPGRPDLRHRRDDRRAQRRPRLRRRRRPAARRAQVQIGLLGARARARRRDRRSIRIAKILKGQNWDRGAALAADRDRRQRQGRRLHPRPSTAGPPRETDGHLRGARRHGRQAGDAAGRTRSRDGKGARDVVVVPDRRRERPLLLRLGAGEHRQGRQGHRRPGRLRPHPRHGRPTA
ncbi:MAG: hypothetical protein MZW92_68555 [Comamonadaceae bacterium]|nr:hypothetical protein [Comamonadaceae bacterium]